MSRSLSVVDNPQPPEKQTPIQRSEDGRPLIEVEGDPWLTIQGEGPFAGRPAVFVRLSGCNLQCRNCDTDYTTLRETVTVENLVGDVVETFGKMAGPNHRKLVVITGGEPFRQFALDVLVRALLDLDYQVQIETNGTLWIDEFPVYNSGLTIVCSPKTPKVRDEIHRYCRYFKYVLSANALSPMDGLPTRVLGMDLIPARCSTGVMAGNEVFVQPEEVIGDAGATKVNTDKCVQVCYEYGYRLSLQQHKILGLL